MLIVLGVTGCDHGTKLLASRELASGKALPLIANVISLERAHNTDTAFSLLSEFVPREPRLLLLKVTATLGALVLAAFTWLRFRQASSLERTALALLLGGAIGNAIDRWRWGYVIDFIHIEHWPIFNVADIALSVGALLTAVSMWQLSRHGAAPVPQEIRTP